ncbi:MAG: hypothetical protein ACOVN9_08500, partial [Inhella sp.]
GVERRLVGIASAGRRAAPQVIAIRPAEQAEAAQLLDALEQAGDAVALMRAHPAYQAPEAWLGGIRQALQQALAQRP